LVLRLKVLLKTSVASMTSTDMITSLASMTSTASLASKNKKQHTLYMDFLAWKTLTASMASTASTTSMASMTSSASFHQKNHWASFFHQPWHQNNLFCSDNVGWFIINSIFSWFLTPFLLEAVEDRDVTYNQDKGS